ncbi:hypothetical protein BHE74_00017809, partial [Ensete ventricosum]
NVDVLFAKAKVSFRFGPTCMRKSVNVALTVEPRLGVRPVRRPRISMSPHNFPTQVQEYDPVILTSVTKCHMHQDSVGCLLQLLSIKFLALCPAESVYPVSILELLCVECSVSDMAPLASSVYSASSNLDIR